MSNARGKFTDEDWENIHNESLESKIKELNREFDRLKEKEVNRELSKTENFD
jgi:hypothetical protein